VKEMGIKKIKGKLKVKGEVHEHAKERKKGKEMLESRRKEIIIFQNKHLIML
jgi:hypothetical protein